MTSRGSQLDMKISDLKQFNLPDAPGVYFFIGPLKRGEGGKRGKTILYIGKATSLRDRVKSYFARDILLTRSPLIKKMLEEADRVEFVETDSVLEALILEANQIKKYQPYANSRDKDDKSYNFVVVTREEFPRILTVRGRELFVGVNNESRIKNKEIIVHNSSFKIHRIFGPFPHSGELKEGLKIIRKIFPYRDSKCKLTGRPCFNSQMSLCPGPCVGWISKRDYRKIIRHIVLFFEGRKETLIKDLEKEMKKLAKEEKFEEAEKVKRQIFALEHIQDVALIKQEVGGNEYEVGFRIEAYDIAHISGTNVVGVMTVVDLPAGLVSGDGEVNKSQYRKFKIRADDSPSYKASEGRGNDDVGNLKQVLERRFGHPEWKFPNMVVVDGGKGQINVARKVLVESGLEMIEVVSVVKDERHRAREIVGSRQYADKYGKEILLANAEAHRFAVGYHRKLRGKGFRI
ncbi:MAG: hypothetical protein EXS69_02135 [Candidatus Zambryskibacteria bacterium]|nr:hypothetical protein [Candidatus Zambryskibacteria bacterium]